MSNESGGERVVSGRWSLYMKSKPVSFIGDSSRSWIATANLKKPVSLRKYQRCTVGMKPNWNDIGTKPEKVDFCSKNGKPPKKYRYFSFQFRNLSFWIFNFVFPKKKNLSISYRNITKTKNIPFHSQRRCRSKLEKFQLHLTPLQSSITFRNHSSNPSPTSSISRKKKKKNLNHNLNYAENNGKTERGEK